MAQQQKILMYALPFIFVITGPNFPVGVLIYWTTTNLWTMGQQFYVIRNNPTPGSEAERALKARREAKAKKKGIVIEGTSQDTTTATIDAPPVNRQRQQPKKSGSRAQRKKQSPGQSTSSSGTTDNDADATGDGSDTKDNDD